MKDEMLQYISIQANRSVCKTDNILEFHPTSPMPVGYRAEISVTKVIEESKCHCPKKL